MSAGTSIEWTDATWSPLRARRKDTGKVGQHCERVSPGCTNCYAAAHNRRNLPNGGTGLDYVRASRDLVETFVDARVLAQPLRWRDPRKVFVCNQTDLFANFYTDEQRAAVFGVMAFARQHTFQVLTKRPDLMRRFFAQGDPVSSFLNAARRAGIEIPRADFEWKLRGPLPNVWLGVTAEDQQRADERVPLLRQTPAAVRFVSYEPALGPVDFTRWVKDWTLDYVEQDPRVDLATLPPRLDWVIAGGESGPGARPCDVAWIRDVVRQCRDAGVACFVKQVPLFECRGCGQGFTRRPEAETDEVHACCLRARRVVSHDPSEWPAEIRVREFPNPTPRPRAALEAP